MKHEKEKLKAYIDQLTEMMADYPETTGHLNTVATHFKLKARTIYEPTKATA